MAKAKTAEGSDGSGAGSRPKTKRQAVQMALTELGFESKPPALHEHILKTWGIDISNNHISSYKSGLKAEMGGGRHSGRKPGRPPGRPPALRDPGLHMKDVQAVKDLVGRLGGERVRELVGLFHQ